MKIVRRQIGTELSQGGKIVLRRPHLRHLFRGADIGRHDHRRERGDMVRIEHRDRRRRGVDPLVYAQVTKKLLNAVAIGLLGARSEPEITEENLHGGIDRDGFGFLGWDRLLTERNRSNLCPARPGPIIDSLCWCSHPQSSRLETPYVRPFVGVRTLYADNSDASRLIRRFLPIVVPDGHTWTRWL